VEGVITGRLDDVWKQSKDPEGGSSKETIDVKPRYRTNKTSGVETDISERQAWSQRRRKCRKANAFGKG